MQRKIKDFPEKKKNRVLNKIRNNSSNIADRLKIEKGAAEVTNLLMSTSLPLSERIRSSMLLILDFMDATKGSLMLPDLRDEDDLVVLEAVSDGKFNNEIVGKVQRHDSKSISSWVFKNKDLLQIKDIKKDKRFISEGSTPFKINYKSNSLLSIPMIDQEDKVIGVLNLTDKKSNKLFTKRDMYAAVMFADRMAPTISYCRFNEQLKKKNEELKDLQRVKTDLTNMVIHDLKGFLGEIISNVDLLTYYKGLPESYKEYLDSAREGCSSLLRLILNLLDISRMEDKRIKLRPQKFDIILLVKSVIKSVKSLAVRKGLVIRINEEENSFYALADKQLIERILDNLLLNAINYSRPNTIIDISVFNHDDFTNISVHDQGEGIPPELHSRIFEKFEQADNGNVKHSTGLGLTFCKMAVEEHQGKIWIESELGKGSTFTFSLPQ